MGEASDTPRSTISSVAALGAVIGAAFGFLGAVATGWFSYAQKNQELQVHLIDVAVSILRADPKEDVAGARRWATEIMEKNSGVIFTPEDRAALLHKPLKFQVSAMAEANKALFKDWDDIVNGTANTKAADGAPALSSSKYFDAVAAKTTTPEMIKAINEQAYKMKEAAEALERATAPPTQPNNQR